MSEAASGAGDLEEIADALYAARPDAFAAARDDAVRTARAEGRQPLARELAKLRKPTQSAWLVNLLWRDSREVMEQFLQLAEELSLAQSQASGPELHRLMAVRRELEGALVRGARALAEKEGVSVTAAMEREAQETLSAALARPEVADEIRTGRLVKPAAYAGFGAVLPSTPSSPSPGSGEEPDPALLEAFRTAKSNREDSRESKHAGGDAPRAPDGSDRDTSGADGRPQGGRAPSTPKIDERQARAAERARERRDAAERALEDARAVFDAAAGTLTEHRDAAEAAEARHASLRTQQDEVQTELGQLQQRVRELQHRLRELQQEVFTSEQAAHAAAARKAQAEKAHEAAVRTLARAEKELKDAGG